MTTSHCDAASADAATRDSVSRGSCLARHQFQHWLFDPRRVQIGLIAADVLGHAFGRDLIRMVRQYWPLAGFAGHHVGTATTRMRLLVYFDGTQ